MRSSPSEQILVASSDTATRSRVRESLDRLPIALEETASGREALARIAERVPELVIVDMLLQDWTGFAFCRALREQPALQGVPVLMLSGYAEEPDRILAFELGVDDFVPKPFFPRELASRVSAILRRIRTRSRRADAGSGDAKRPLRLDAERGRLEVHGRPLDLTPKEFEIVTALLRHEGRVLSRQQIVDEVWAGRAADPRVVDAHVKSIRRKLGDVSAALQTIRGVGFRFSPRDAGAGAAGREAEGPEAA